MVIKKYFIDSPRAGYTFDRREKRYFSWGYDIWLNRTRVTERGFKSKELAEEIVNKLRQDAKYERHGITPPSRSPQLIELFQKKLDSLGSAKRERTRSKTVFKRFLSMLPPGIKVVELKQAHIQQYVTARLSDPNGVDGKTITPQTVRRELVPIVAALNSAAAYFTELDGYRPPNIPRPKVPKGRKDRVISRNEQAAILGSLLAPRKEKEHRLKFEQRIRTGLFLQFCLLTLSRPGEVAALKWSDVDLEAMTVSIEGTKTRYTSNQPVRRLKITQTMLEIIEERRKMSRSKFVFTTGGVVTEKMYTAMRAACEENGLKYGRNKTAIQFHTTRHTGITRLQQRGVDLKTIGSLSGHSDAGMVMYYSHANTTLTNAASDILEDEIA